MVFMIFEHGEPGVTRRDNGECGEPLVLTYQDPGNQDLSPPAQVRWECPGGRGTTKVPVQGLFADVGRRVTTRS